MNHGAGSPGARRERVVMGPVSGVADRFAENSVGRPIRKAVEGAPFAKGYGSGGRVGKPRRPGRRGTAAPSDEAARKVFLDRRCDFRRGLFLGEADDLAEQ